MKKNNVLLLLQLERGVSSIDKQKPNECDTAQIEYCFFETILDWFASEEKLVIASEVNRNDCGFKTWLITPNKAKMAIKKLKKYTCLDRAAESILSAYGYKTSPNVFDYVKQFSVLCDILKSSSENVYLIPHLSDHVYFVQKYQSPSESMGEDGP
jgi:hypothetical protein